MGFIDKLDRHGSIMAKMAKTLGVDFAEKIYEDPNVVTKYREAVLRCSHCQHEGECQGWMDEHASARETPDYCRNKDLLENLRGA